jgi:hypothetical protein
VATEARYHCQRLHAVLIKPDNFARSHLSKGGQSKQPSWGRVAKPTSRTSSAAMAEKQQVSEATTQTSRLTPRRRPMLRGLLPRRKGRWEKAKDNRGRHPDRLTKRISDGIDGTSTKRNKRVGRGRHGHEGFETGWEVDAMHVL